jgi:hypothetical protein
VPITAVKIFPSIGIARLGNSPTEYFIGPEIPGVRPVPAGGYRDGACRIKRQAARFRIFGYDGSTLVQEITAADALISWTVHLANKKASWMQSAGTSPSGLLRNSSVKDRASLEIDPGPRTLTGPNAEAAFNTGRFLGLPVPLGQMRTDADGRLLVLGGFGWSGSVPPGIPVLDYANNNSWFDDASDGPVTATVKGLAGTAGPLVATPAWVICAPPDFAPPIDTVTSLYDLLFQEAVDSGWLQVPATPSFTTHVSPILRRVLDMQRTNKRIGEHHFTFAAAFGPGASFDQRNAVVKRVRDPNNPTAAGEATMPLLWDDNHGNEQVITKSQYAILTKWRDGNYLDDWPGTPPAPGTAITPDGLTRAALEACSGGGFRPGLETGWFLRDTYAYSEAFRLSHTGRTPGDITKQLAVPWQADFLSCADEGGYAWWPAQRPDQVYPEGGGGQAEWTRDIVTYAQDMVDHWHKLGFVVDQGGALVETERRVVCSYLFMITDRSEFSLDEVSAALTAGTPAKFESALYVVADGFQPSELGVTNANPTSAELQAWAPALAFQRPDGPVTQLDRRPVALLLQDKTLPATTRQRFTFVYDLEFSGTNDFGVGGITQEMQEVTVTATKDVYTTSGTLRLLNQPNPYLVDGATSWLSTDLRVFQLTAGDVRYGFTVGPDAAAAVSFIGKVVNYFRGLPVAGHPFDALTQDQQASRLELAEKVGGKRVFNFAVARVRYKGQALAAKDVRMFFRLFTTAATGLDYDVSTYPRTALGSAPRPLLGIQGGRLVTIPCLGVARDDTTTVPMGTAEDTLNVATLNPAGAVEAVTYFGAWLDFNQTTPRFPVNPVPYAGPWTTGLQSIQELIRGMHQCLVAEVYFTGNPIPFGATPANNDNLAQRNLVIDESANPGTPPTRTVAHTLEIKAPRPVGSVEIIRELPASLELAVAPEPVVVTHEPGLDELMIRMDGLPDGSDVLLYLPDVDADALVRIAGQRYESVSIQRVDAHTLRCLPGGVCYVPLPDGRTQNIPGLLTVELPQGVRREQMFHVVVHQVSGQPRRVLGSFQFTIPVSTARRLRGSETRKLSVLRHIQRRLEPEDPWRAVFNRYLGLVADRVDGFGGNATRVEPSPTGSGTDEAALPCRRRARLVTVLLALLVAVAALHPLPAYVAEIAVTVGLIVAATSWRIRCAPSRCAVVATVIAGLALGIGVTGVLWLLGVAGLIGVVDSLVVAVLASTGIVLALAMLAAVRWRCFTPSD